MVENLTQPVSSGTSTDVPPGAFASTDNLVDHISTLNPGPSTASSSNIREVDFKKGSDDIVQTLGSETDAILITYERIAGEIKLYHNGVEIDKAVLCPLKPGEASLHHGLTLHASKPNNSKDRRIGLNFQYITTDLKQLKSKDDSALCVRGKDNYNFYKKDVIAEENFDIKGHQRLIERTEHYKKTIRVN